MWDRGSKLFWWPCSLVSRTSTFSSCFLLFFWFGPLLDAHFCCSSSLVSSGFFTVEAAEIPLFWEFRLLEGHFGCSSLVDWSDFLAFEADGEQLVLVAWFLAVNCSEVAWCLFPWRWELKVTSLWVVNWHTAQAHLWTRIFHVRPHSIGETRFFFLFVKNWFFEKKLESPPILFLFWRENKKIGRASCRERV